MLFELICLATIIGCGKRIHKAQTEKIYFSPANNTAQPSIKKDFDETLRVIRENRKRRDLGEYIPNATEEKMRYYLRKKLKPEKIKEMEKAGRL